MLAQCGVIACRPHSVIGGCDRDANDMTRAMRYRAIRPGVGMSGEPNPCSDVRHPRSLGSPTGREPYGDGAPIVVRGRESRSHGEVGQVVGWQASVEVRDMRDAETTLAIIQAGRPVRTRRTQEGSSEGD